MKRKSIVKWLMLFVITLSLLIPVSIAESVPASDTVRVAVAVSGSSMEFVTHGEYQIVEQRNGNVIAQLGSNERWRVENRDGWLFMYGPGNILGPYGGTLAVQASSAVTASVIAGEGNILDRVSIRGMKVRDTFGNTVTLADQDRLRVLSATGTGELAMAGNETFLLSLSANSLNTRYRGDILFMIEDGTLMAVNRLNVEDYLRGVIAAEMPSTWPEEALKAQAVTSRTYAMHMAGESKESAYDLTSDQYTQMYRGYDGEYSSTSKAVQDTTGVVMLNHGKPVQAYFHSSSGGYTENSEDVWLTPLPSIKARIDSYDINDAHYNWQVYYSAYQLTDRFRNSASFKSISNINCVYTDTGTRVREMTVIGLDYDDRPLQIKISNADRVRTTLGLKSALFRMDKTFDEYNNLSGVRLTGSGFGHGLGMSQYGARGMALEGYDYRDILRFYFTDIVVVGNYGE
ncbi:MAG: SpoIID/LytB domain-containing protein [Peptococcaceae bacterium]|nr:SpoIID/LytB domain-containing protein [Peptococcaceae bacterium]